MYKRQVHYDGFKRAQSGAHIIQLGGSVIGLVQLLGYIRVPVSYTHLKYGWGRVLDYCGIPWRQEATP